MISIPVAMYLSASCIVFPFVEELTNTKGGKGFGGSLLKDESSVRGRLRHGGGSMSVPPDR
jgi:hypothetical protein